MKESLLERPDVSDLIKGSKYANKIYPLINKPSLGEDYLDSQKKVQSNCFGTVVYTLGVEHLVLQIITEKGLKVNPNKFYYISKNNGPGFLFYKIMEELLKEKGSEIKKLSQAKNPILAQYILENNGLRHCAVYLGKTPSGEDFIFEQEGIGKPFRLRRLKEEEINSPKTKFFIL